jgi:anthranilate phosphoribosyltransferase
MKEIVEGEATPAQVAALIVALRMKGETAEEIAGFARVMRDYATHVDAGDEVVDVVGTGGDNAHTFNISTVSALVVAAAGGKVAKHGNRGITSACGAADFLEGLGIPIDFSPEQVGKAVREVGFGFMFAPIYHPAMRHAIGPRREIGVRTVFNLLGPVTNPAGETMQLTGVAVPEMAERIAEVLARLGSKRALVVYGGDGVDEISISAPTSAFFVEHGGVRPMKIEPEMFGLKSAPRDAVRGGTLERNIELANQVLSGQQGPARDVVLLNAAGGLFAAGIAADMAEGVERAASLIDRGAVAAHLEKVQAYSQALKSAEGTAS